MIKQEELKDDTYYVLQSKKSKIRQIGWWSALEKMFYLCGTSNTVEFSRFDVVREIDIS